MTENVRKRASKWDLVPETPIPAEAQHSNNDRSEKAGDSDHDKSSNSEWNTSKLSDNQALNLSDVGPKDTTMSKDSGWSNWDRLSGKQEKKDGNGDGNEFSSTAKGWGGDQSSMSPGLDAWRQRSRSRSPKSGWSSSHRSRSRSPSHSFKRETDGWNDRSRGGNQGRFHQDAHSYDGGRHSNSGPTESRGSRQQRSLPTGHADGDIFVDSHGQRGYLRNRHSHGERRKDPERERRIVCNDFLKGKCFRGSMCRYAHQDSSDGHGRWPPNGGRERTHDRKDPVMSFENHQRHTTYRKHNKEPLPCKYFLEGCCRNGASCKFSHLGPMHDSPNWRRRDDRWGPSPDNENSLSGVPRSPKWRCDNSSARVSVSDVEAPEKFLDSHRDQQACYTNKEESRQNCEDLPPWDPLETYQILPNKAPEIPLPANKQETAQEVSILQQHVLNGNSTMEVDLPVNHLPSVVAGTAVSFNPNEQSQQIGLRAPPNPHFPTQMGTEGTVPKPDMKDPRLVLMTPETAIARNMVTSEQVTQITNLSASILPQLYASLNPLAAAGLVPSLAISHPNSVRPLTPLAVPLVQPNQGLWPQIKQYDPISDSMEPANPPANPPGFAPDLVKQQKDSVEELGPPKNSASSTEITEFNNGNHEKTCGFEEKGKFDQKNHISEQDELRRDPEAKEINEGNGNGEKEQEKGNSKDTATSVGQVDEESMKNKEAKGMRMFKFALVELVKEILKPTWKEGHMSKEAHKTIVKKVVDKVTGTLQGPQIPQTQEKIDHYLSFSKPKLEKLVQAYVEKYLNI